MSLEAIRRLREEKRRSLREAGAEEKEHILRYIAVPPYMLRARNPMHAAVIVGPMFSGKTSFAEAKIGEAIKQLIEKYNVDESRIAYVHSYERSVSEVISYMSKQLDLKKLTHIFFFNDDAIATETAFSRFSWKEEAASEAMYYVMIRHRLRKLGFTGYLFVMHATQVFSLLDKTFRQTAALKFFKDYPDEPNDMRLMGIMLGKAGMMALNQLSLKLWSPLSFRHYLEAVYSAVAKLKRMRRIVRAYKTDPEKDPQEYRRWLNKTNNIIIEAQGPGEAGDPETQITTTKTQQKLNKLALEILQYLRLKHRLKFNGDHIVLLLDGKKLTISRKYLPPEWLKKLKAIKVPRKKRSSFSGKE